MKNQISPIYLAATNQAAVMNLSQRGKLSVQGPDRIGFMHSMLTNDVKGLDRYAGCYAAFLTPRGKMITDLQAYRLPGELLLDVPPDRSRVLLERLSDFIVMDDVTLQDVSPQLGHIAVVGPKGREALREKVGEIPSKHLQVSTVVWNSVDCWVVCNTEMESSEVFGPVHSIADLLQDLKADGPGLPELDCETWDLLRLEKGIPAFGVDMMDGNYPMEVGLNNAISFSKGCYVGQEVVAKATYVGGVPRLLMGLRINEDLIPAASSEILDSEGNKIGVITSAGFSPKWGQVIALGYVKRPFAKAGVRCQVQRPDSKPVAALLVDRISGE